MCSCSPLKEGCGEEALKRIASLCFNAFILAALSACGGAVSADKGTAQSLTAASVPPWGPGGRSVPRQSVTLSRQLRTLAAPFQLRSPAAWPCCGGPEGSPRGRQEQAPGLHCSGSALASSLLVSLQVAPCSKVIPATACLLMLNSINLSSPEPSEHFLGPGICWAEPCWQLGAPVSRRRCLQSVLRPKDSLDGL